MSRLHWRSRYLDAVVPAILAVSFPIELLNYRPADLALALPLAFGVVLVLLARRTAPLAMFVAMLVLAVGLQYAAPGYDHTSISFIVMWMYSLYSLGALLTGRAAWLGLLLLLVAVTLGVLSDGDTSPVGIFFFLMFFGLPWSVGVAIRLRMERVSALDAANAALQEQARQAVAHERARIARELHDVVAHAIAITVLQARGGRRMVGRDRDAVRRALGAIEQTNTAALADMRRLLALLRETDTEGSREEPAPSLERLEHLLRQVRESGLPVDLDVAGEPLPVPPGLDLSAYRIVQEALTNVLKHAGPEARARVELAYGADDLAVNVTNVGRQPDAPGTSGHGLIGIRERVHVAGGSLEAGPESDGFAVRARLPYLAESR